VYDHGQRSGHLLLQCNGESRRNAGDGDSLHEWWLCQPDGIIDGPDNADGGHHQSGYQWHGYDQPYGVGHGHA
jgi:hypothetical protein